MKKAIYALHGFLGKPEDWDFLKQSTPDLHAINLSDYHNLSLADWAKTFNAHVKVHDTQHNILVGYSLGGRLALHALLDNPSLWQQAVLISTHPGLHTVEEKTSRITADVHWANRFENESWEPLMQGWHEQSVFQSDSFLYRHEADYKRAALAHQLRHWSTGFQADLREAIATLPMPMLWIAGEKDAKYLECMKTLSFCHPQSKTWIAPNAGHRVLWDAKEELTKIFYNL